MRSRGGLNMSQLENNTIQMIKYIEDKTISNIMKWESHLMDSGFIKYISIIPNSNVEVILLETNTVPQLFLKQNNSIDKVVLRYELKQALQPAEQAVSSLLVEIRSNLRKRFSYGKWIETFSFSG